MKKIFIIIITSLAFFLRAEYLEDLEVIKVVDGDTIHATHHGQLYKIRLSEIDAPERDQEGGKESSAYLSALIIDGVIDIKFLGKDSYGRDLGRIYDNGRDINRMLVQAGMAWVYDYYVNDKSLYKDQKIAKKNKKGLWTNENAQAPWDWRRLSRFNLKQGSSTNNQDRTQIKEKSDIPKRIQSISCCKICKKGKACGNSCIRASFTCRQPPGCACDAQ